MIEAYPLQWPVGYPRTKNPVLNTNFAQYTFAAARKSLVKELERLKATQVIISTNIPIRADGGYHANYDKRKIDDKAVAVYFILDGEQRVLCCDAWDNWEDNMHAITKTIDALRGLSRWKVSEIMRRTFSGLKELPFETEASKNVWEILGLKQQPGTVEAVHDHYLMRAKECHPDKPGGSHDAFAELQNAYQLAIKFF